MTIDGKNIQDFTAHLLAGSYKGLVEYPSLKKVESNDWAEHDGLEVDLESPKLDKKEFEMSFFFTEKGKLDSFISYLAATTYRTYTFSDLGQSYKLRIVAFSKPSMLGNSCELKVKFSDDYPLKGYSYTAPSLSVSSYGFLIDGVDASKYGIIPTLGVLDEMHKEGGVKGNLQIENSAIDGVWLNNQALKKKHTAIKLGCFIKLPLVDFWKGYKAFLFDLKKPNERTLTIEGKTIKAYYKGAKVLDFFLKNNIVWCHFDIELIKL